MSPARAAHPLRGTERPEFEIGDQALRVVDLFCGCGGLTLGVAQAAHAAGYALDVPLAVDLDERAVATYRLNFPKANVSHDLVDKKFDGALGRPVTKTEAAVLEEVGEVHAAIGGPPCQGHSDLNNHTRRDDPKNALYARMARAAEVLRCPVLLVENVPTVMNDKAAVVNTVIEHLEHLGYNVATAVMKLENLGVAQRRRRHVLLALRADVTVSAADVMVACSTEAKSVHDLRWAIGDLVKRTAVVGIDQPPRASAANLERMQWLIDNDEYDLPNRLRPACHQDDQHSYKSMYGRLRWDEPAQTITSGYGSIGQGRYMHPDQLRALSPHEAARLQHIPDYFEFPDDAARAELATMIGNAVPPAMSSAIFSMLIARGAFEINEHRHGR